jgi:NAD+ diphosphatase
MRNLPNLYAGGTLDRAALQRKNAAWLTERLGAPGSRLLPVWRSQTWIDDREPGAPRLVSVPAEAAPDLIAAPGVEAALLGLDGPTTWFALDLSDLETPDDHPALRGRGRFVELRTVGALLPQPEANLAAYARGLLWWHQRHRFCGVCGQPTASAEAGHVRKCQNPACATAHFPRTDPAVIMLVHDGAHCLLGRQPRFPPAMYSTLAGFVEPGESLEEAVAREVLEETGVRITEPVYQSSQPWPFPSSLMLGFHVRALTRAITVHAEELEDARWFHRDEVQAAADGDPRLKLPRADSISRRLIETWLQKA